MSDLLDLEQYKKYFAEEVTDQTPLVMFHGKVMTLIAEVERLRNYCTGQHKMYKDLTKERDELKLTVSSLRSASKFKREYDPKWQNAYNEIKDRLIASEKKVESYEKDFESLKNFYKEKR